MKLIKLFVLFLSALSLSLQAQQYHLSDKLPIDKDVRIGVLSNGLTYYIRKNSLPQNRVELRLVVNAGSVLEDEDQRGLAHFTEHMAFNGTKHFEKNELISYLQSVGVKFGNDLNAYTSFDETVYRLLVPTDNKDALEKAFFVLEDWAHSITFAPEEIESERGVITEEWRIGRGANQRLQDKYFPVLFYNSKYAERLPIGKIDVIKTFKPESILQFYHNWYRPDLMAVIVVGDIDPDQYERFIKEHFANIPAPAKEMERKIFELPGHEKTLYSINSDKEATQTQVMIFNKIKHTNDSTLADYRKFIVSQLYFFMFNQRFGDLARSQNPPFIFARASEQSVTRNNDAFSVNFRVKENTVEQGLKAVLIELERVKRYGFTETELERAKKSVLKKYEKAYAEKDKSESEGYASELIRNFLNKEAIPGISFEYDFTKNQLPLITLNEVNDYDSEFFTDSNRVVIVNGPDKEGITLPTEEDLKKVNETVLASNVEPVIDKKVEFTWPGKLPAAGKIIKEEKNEKVGVTSWTLSNGAKVLLKPTDFKNNEIYAIAYSSGGYNFAEDKDYYSALYSSALINESGISCLNKSDLIKALAGKDISVSPFVGSTNEGISGHLDPKDTEVFFQLLNLYFSQAKIDTVAFNSFISKTKTSLATIKLNPQRYFDDQVARIMSCNHPRGGGYPSESDLDKIDYSKSLEFFKQRFANAGDFTFVFVGNIDFDKIKPFIETYIASLPGNKSKEIAKDLGIRPPKGLVEKKVYKGTDSKSMVNLIFTGECKYNADEEFLLDALNDVLNIKLMESLREKMGGVYGVRASGRISKFPYQNYQERISFQCSPEKADSLITAALAEIEKIKQSGVEAKDLEKIKETQKRELEVNLKDNIFWTNELVNDVVYSLPFTTSEKMFEQINNISSKDIKILANKYFGKNFVKLILYPEGKN
jgi:zinc protease